MVGVPPFFYEFLEHVSNGGKPEDFRPEILTRFQDNSRPAARRSSPGVRRSDRIPLPKKKRKVSRYQRVFGKHLKALKRKHPRTNISVLMKKAHVATRRELK